MLENLLEMLQAYHDQFETRLSESNLSNLQTLIRIAQSILQFCREHCPTTSFSKTVNEFLFDTKLDDINFLKSVRWIQESKLPFKVSLWKLIKTSFLPSRSLLMLNQKIVRNQVD